LSFQLEPLIQTVWVTVQPLSIGRSKVLQICQVEDADLVQFVRLDFMVEVNQPVAVTGKYAQKLGLLLRKHAVLLQRRSNFLVLAYPNTEASG
jgi:hypothetical protein